MLSNTGTARQMIANGCGPGQPDHDQHAAGGGEISKPGQRGGQVRKVVDRRNRRDHIERSVEGVGEGITSNPGDSIVLRCRFGEHVSVDVNSGDIRQHGAQVSRERPVTSANVERGYGLLRNRLHHHAMKVDVVIPTRPLINTHPAIIPQGVTGGL
jgi:hypothetical protein